MKLLFIDNVNEAKKYLQRGYDIVHGVDSTHYMYQYKPEWTRPKRYYTPIIPVLVNALGRIRMHQLYNQFKDSLLYTNTDSLIYDANTKIKIELSNELGELKQVHTNKPCLIYGRNSYMIGEEIKVSGIHKKDITKENFTNGLIETTKMTGIKQTNDINNAGKFTKEQKDLKKQRENYEEIKELMKTHHFFMDHTINNLGGFASTIQKGRLK